VPAEKYIEAEAKIELMLERIKKLEQSKSELRTELEKCLKANSDLRDGMRLIEEEAQKLEDTNFAPEPLANLSILLIFL